MNSIKISVIVPVFNAANYLTQCVKSILNQTLQAIEIIIVNDGSTDGSKQLILDLAKQDSRIVFVDSCNRGVSSARNKGIQVASGEFISFVDVDDWIDPLMLEALYNAATQIDAELSVCNVNIYNNNTYVGPRLKFKNNVVNVAVNDVQTLQDFMDFKYDYSNWNKLYKHTIIQAHSIHFDEKMTIWEDLLFNIIFLQYITKMALVEERLYNYRIHQSSVTSNKERDFIPQFNFLFEGYRSCFSNPDDEAAFNIFKSKMANSFYNTLIPALVLKTNAFCHSYSSFVSILTNELNRINKEIFVFNKSELKGVQGIKKRWLMKGKFQLVAHVIAIKHYLFKGNKITRNNYRNIYSF